MEGSPPSISVASLTIAPKVELREVTARFWVEEARCWAGRAAAAAG